MSNAPARRKILALAFVALLGAEAVAVASGAHKLPDYQESPIVRALFDRIEAPDTGEPLVNRLLQDILDAHHQRVQLINQTLWNASNVTTGVVAGRIFEDNVSQDGRIGGFGAWSQRGAGAFNESGHVPLRGNWSYWYGDARGLYPEAATAYFISPVIDLRHVVTGKELDGRTRLNQTEQALLDKPTLDAVFLAFSHSFNFANGTDGGRVEVLDRLPANGSAPPYATALMPVELQAFVREGDVEPPAYERVSRFQGEEKYNNNTAARGFAFTGASERTTSLFDLTPFAGREIHIAFAVRTHLQPGGAASFSDATRFERPDRFGWQIDDILVKGPLLPGNLRVHDLSVSPSQRDPLVGAHTVAPGDEVEIRVVAHNAGGSGSNATLTVSTFAQGAATAMNETRTRLRLEAGEVREIVSKFRIANEGNYSIRAALLPTNDTTVTLDGANRRDILVKARAIRDVGLDVTVEPFYVPANGEGTVWANVTNRGNVPGTWRLALGIRNITNTTHDHAEAFLDGAPTRTVELTPGESTSFAWKVRPTRADRYLVTGTLLPGEGAAAIATDVANLNVEIGPKIVFHDAQTDAYNWTGHPLKVPQWPWTVPNKSVWAIPELAATERHGLLGHAGASTAGSGTPGRDFTLDLTYYYSPSAARPAEPIRVLVHDAAPGTLGPSMLADSAESRALTIDPQPASDTSGWRRVQANLDAAIAKVARSGNAISGWDPSRLHVEVVTSVGDVYVKEMKLEYLPVGAFQRETVFHYAGEPLRGAFESRRVVNTTQPVLHDGSWREMGKGELPLNGMSRSLWQWGAPTSGPGAAASGTNVWATSLGGTYGDLQCAALLTPPMDLTSATSASLTFREWRHMENDSETAWDAGLLFVTRDNGATYDLVAPEGGYPSPGIAATPRACLRGQAEGAAGLSGPVGATPPHPSNYSELKVDLGAHVGHVVRFAFAFASDAAISRAGWYIDDLNLTIDGAIVAAWDMETNVTGFEPVAWSPTPSWSLRSSPWEPRQVPVWEARPGHRLVSPEISLADAPEPVLTFRHRYGTIMTRAIFATHFDVAQVAVVELQVKGANGEWGPWQRMEPAGGYPRNASAIENVSGAFLGRGYFAPSDVVLDQNILKFVQYGGTRGWEDATFDLGAYAGQVVRLGFHMTPNVRTWQGDPSHGWWIRDITLAPAAPLVNDLSVASVDLVTAYDYATFGVPARVEIPVVATVRNAGLRAIARAEVVLNVTDVGNGSVTTIRACDEGQGAECVLALSPGEARVLTFRWTPPANGRVVEMDVRARILGAVPDENPHNATSGLRDRLRLATNAVVAAEVKLEATPLEGGLSPRVLRPLVANVGNVAWDNATLARTIVFEGGIPVSETTWRLADGTPPDGRFRPLLDATLAAKGPGDRAVDLETDILWTPPAVGAYGATFRLAARGGENQTAIVEASESLRARDTIFSDDFADARVGGVGSWTPTGAAGWELSRSAGLLRFGSPGGTYPAGADAQVVSPTVDLTTTKNAQLTIFTNYSLEGGYDGGLVEASLDAGRTWTRLAPDRSLFLPVGYPAVLAPSNPLNPEHDPLLDVRAFTGRSADASPLASEAGGRIPVTYPLHQLGGLAHVVDVAPLDVAPGIATGLELVEGSARSFGNATWHAEGYDDLTWSIENLTYATPLPRDSTHMHLLGMGTQPTDVIGAITFSIPTGPDVDLQYLVLDVWDWRDGTFGKDRNGSQTYAIDVCDPTDCAFQSDRRRIYKMDEEAVNLGYVKDVAVDGDWTLRRIDVGRLVTDKDRPCDPCDQLRLVMEAFPRPGSGDRYSPNSFQGWAFGPARLHTLHNARTWSVLDPAVEGTWSGGHRVTRAPDRLSGFEPAVVDGQVEWRWTPKTMSDARLVSPPLDLNAVSGAAALTFGHRVPAGASGLRTVEVQALDPVTGEWGAWRTLFTNVSSAPTTPVIRNTTQPRAVLDAAEVNATGYERVAIGAPTGFDRAPRPFVEIVQGREVPRGNPDFTYSFTNTSGNWRDMRFDLTPYAGQVVRVGFHVASETVPTQPYWYLRDIAVQGAAFEGKPIQFRLRAVTDANGNAGFWDLQEAVVSGSSYGLNARLTLTPEVNKTADTVVNLTASLRQLGRTQLPATSLALVVQPPAVVLDAAGAPAAGNMVLLGPPSASAAADRAIGAASFKVRLPETAGVYAVRATVMELTANGPRVVPVEIPGFLSAAPLIERVEAKADLQAHVAVPLESRPETPAPVTVTIRNNGTSTIAGTWTLTATHERAGVACTAGGSFTLRAFTDEIVTRTCALTQKGRYTIVLTATAGSQSVKRENATFVAPEKAFYATDFEEGSLGWRSRATPASESRPTAIDSTGAENGPPASNSPRYGVSRNSAIDEWRLSDSSARSGAKAWLFGPETDQFEKGVRYSDFVDASLESPPIDLRGVPGGQSFLSFWHRPSFSVGDGGVVEARQVDAETGAPLSPWIRLAPIGGYPGITRSVGVFTSGDSGPVVCQPCNLNPLGDLTPAFTGISDEWQPAVVDLAQDARLAGAVVQVRFRVGTMEATGGDGSVMPWQPAVGQGWFVDDVNVVGAALRLSPAAQTLRQGDGLTKPHYVRVDNLGGVDAEIEGAIVWDRSSAEADQIFQLVDVPERIPGGHARAVRVDARAPTLQSGFSSEQRLAVRISLDGVPSVGQEALLDLRLTPRAHANLVARIEMAPQSRLETGVPHSILTVVENRGEVPTAEAVVRVEAVYVPTGDVFQVGTAPLPALGARSAGHVVHLTWTPPSAFGPYLLRAVADPDGVNTNSNPADGVAEVEVQVVALRRPDLRITSLRAATPGGLPLAGASEGDLVEFSGLIFNAGTADAVETTVHLIVGGVVAKVERIARLAPGGSAPIFVNQFVPGGDVAFAIEATTASVEVRTDNNREEAILPVVGADARWAGADGRALASAAATAGRPLALRLQHAGGEERTYVLSAQTPRGMDVLFQPRTVVLAPGETADVNVTVRADRFIRAGIHAITVQAAPVEPGLAAILPTRVEVPWDRDVDLAAYAAAGAPGELRVSASNDGNGREELVVRVRDEGGAVLAARNVTLAPGAVESISIAVLDPARAAPGAHALTVELASDNVSVATAQATLDIPASATAIVEAPADEPGRVVVRATGNSPVRVHLDVRTDVGTEIPIQPPMIELAPGEEARAILLPPRLVRATPQLDRYVVTATTEETGAVDSVDLSFAPDPRLLSIVGGAYHPGGAATPSGVRMEVRNDAETSSGAFRVRLYVDGVLAAIATPEPVPAGDASEVFIPWTPAPSGHAVVVVVESLEAADVAAAGSAFALVVPPQEQGGLSAIQRVPGPSSIAILALVGVVALLGQRRRLA